MKEAHNFLHKYRDEILKCTNCGFCQARCPVFDITLRAAYNTRGKILILKEVIAGYIEISHDLAETFYTCTTCQACTHSCPRSIKGAEIVEYARKKLYREGFAPPQLKGVRQSIFETGNVFSSAREDRIEVYPPALRETARKGDLKDEAETLIFMGCLPSYLDMKIVPATIKALNAAGVDYTTLGLDEICCGFPLFLLGTDEFTSHANKLVDRIKATGASELVTPCAGCYKTFENLYPQIKDLGIEVYHTVQYLDKLIAQGKLGFTGSMAMRVTYHDPCDLGRACEIFDEPRKILKNVPALDYVEMGRSKLDARCCGGGGNLQAYRPDLAQEMAVKRVRDALAVGAEVIVSGCPACKDNLKKGARAIPREERSGIKIMDVSEIVANAL
ncbi:MAG: (Fe-S)-binding protein [Deltaproteobacteria bacterium]|nr:(Fe-S)-binding protein [Deltaproteobacteria bacterium]